MERDLARLQHILAIARTRSFVRAAEQLHISQPALSRSIKLFEEKHKLRVFDRGRGGAVPTAAGAQIIREAGKIVQSLRELHHNVRRYSEQGAGLIRIVLAPMLPRLVLPRLTRLVFEGAQHALFDAVIPTVDELAAHLHDERNEMTFCALHQTFGQTGLIVETVGRLPLGAFVRTDHPLPRSEAITVADLVRFPILCVSDLTDSRIESKAGGMICSDTDALLGATLQSDGVWLSAPKLVEQELRGGSLRMLELRGFEFEKTEICVAYRQGRTLSGLARAMISEVQAILA